MVKWNATYFHFLNKYVMNVDEMYEWFWVDECVLLGLLGQSFPLFSNLYSTLGIHVLCLNVHGKCLYIWPLAGLLDTHLIGWSNDEKFLTRLHGDVLSQDYGPQCGLLGGPLHFSKAFMHKPLSCYQKSICLGRARYEFSKTHFRRGVLGFIHTSSLMLVITICLVHLVIIKERRTNKDQYKGFKKCWVYIWVKHVVRLCCHSWIYLLRSEWA